MAEIKIEKKNSNNWLPWLFGILGLVLLGWLAVDVFDKDGEPELLTADENNFPDAHLTDRPDDDVLNAKGDGEHAHHNHDTDFDKNWDGQTADYKSNMTYYLSSIDQLDDQDMNVHHDYSNVALRALSNSLMALAKETDMVKAAEVKSKCEMIKKNAAEITEDWKDTNHADLIRDAAMSSVEALKEIQEEKFPDLKNEVMDLEKAAQKIKGGTLTLDQKKSVKNFFRTAADVLGKMRTV